MKKSHYEKQVLGYPICIDLQPLGKDLLVQITGGCAPHIGSISVGYWEKGRSHLKTILLPEHRDDIVGDEFAKTLYEHLHIAVTVICGIHYEAPGKDGLAEIVACTERLLQDILTETK